MNIVAAGFYFSLTAAASAAPSNTLGFTAIGSNLDQNDANRLSGSRVVVGLQNAYISSIAAYVGAVDTAPHNQFGVAIYTDANGAPGQLVSRSQTGTLQPNSWNTLPVQATLVANTAYWLVYNTNASTSSLNGLFNTSGADESELRIAQAQTNSGFVWARSHSAPGRRWSVAR